MLWALLLLLSLLAVLLSTFVFLPALLYKLSQDELIGEGAYDPAA